MNDGVTLDDLVVRVRADTGGFLAGVGEMRRELDGPLAEGAARAGGGIERALLRAAGNGKLEFADLRRVAVAALGEIARAASQADFGGGGGIVGAIAGVASAFLGGRPGRATGGSVSNGRAYMVGERGPELFVPTSAGRIETGGGGSFGGRGPVNVTINIAGPREATPQLMTQTANQVARAVRQALARAEA
jgi:hypothetical protein